MQRVTSATSLHKAAPEDPAVGRVDPDKSPVVEVAVGVERKGLPPAATASPATPLPPRGKGSSYTSLNVADDSAGKYRAVRRKSDWACELQRIAMFVVVFSLMAWITYLFLTKDE